MARDHGGYFKSSSHVTHSVHQGNTVTVLVGGRILQGIAPVAEVVLRHGKAPEARVTLYPGLLR